MSTVAVTVRGPVDADTGLVMNLVDLKVAMNVSRGLVTQ